ncbi:hypothetical protein SNOG_10437 [Parastagonospora nodorum SN15]|uniref:Uncharacterized protein n=1 Tax=Phaeosphaeria nodorum (strain SN15 / ATCC MYA-4574 / FGSC 10173) TaxID=321614 RepID=Q0UCS7_PHANO|nr:hypothetical protein SNOG_10437 [Parastagonospora nodorum SN15]EAT81831.1 hypothetical protein SNOG_10437 [Parastagonospora nodorum SN15]
MAGSTRDWLPADWTNCTSSIDAIDQVEQVLRCAASSQKPLEQWDWMLLFRQACLHPESLAGSPKSFVASGALRGSSDANLRELQQREIALGAAP